MSFITQEEEQTLIAHKKEDDKPKLSLFEWFKEKILYKCCPQFIPFKIFLNTEINIGNKIPNKKTLVLDIDETLIRSYVLEPPEFFDFSFQIANDGKMIRVYSIKRPGLDEFLAEVKNLYEIVFFTASTKEYGDKVINFLLPETPENHRLFRDSCTFKNGFFIKNLNNINRDLKDIIIVDNNPISFLFNTENGIEASSYFGEEDNYLIEELLPKLRILAKSEDVRDVIIENKWY